MSMKSLMRAGVLTVAASLATLTLSPPAQAMPEPIGRWKEPVVQVYSSAPGFWMVNKAIKRWNEAGVVTLQRSYTPCTGGPCITVIEADQIPGKDPNDVWAGLAEPATDEEGYFKYCNIVLRTRYRDIPRYWMVTQHELGHCLGLPDLPNTKWSIMNSISAYEFKAPRPSDYRRLETIYYG